MEALAVAEAQRFAEKGSADALFFLGHCHMNGHAVERNEEKALGLFHRAAERNHDRARAHVGLCYMEGIGIPAADPAKGKEFLKGDGAGPIAQLTYAKEILMVHNADFPPRRVRFRLIWVEGAIFGSVSKGPCVIARSYVSSRLTAITDFGADLDCGTPEAQNTVLFWPHTSTTHTTKLTLNSKMSSSW